MTAAEVYRNPQLDPWAATISISIIVMINRQHPASLNTLLGIATPAGSASSHGVVAQGTSSPDRNLL